MYMSEDVQPIYNHRDKYSVANCMFTMSAKLLATQMLSHPLKQNSIAHLDSELSAISSTLKSNRFVSNISSLSFESRILTLRKTFSERFCVVPITTISSDKTVELAGNENVATTRTTAFFLRRETKN